MRSSSTRTRQRQRQVDLEKSFRAVARTLKENKETLNAADEYNHNHGDNMVKNFQVITKAMREKRGSEPAEQLAYASQVLAERSQSGSGQMYAQNLARAADTMRGQNVVTPESAMTLVQALMGGQPGVAQPGTTQGDAMSSMLGALMSSQAGTGQAGTSQDDPMSTIMGAIMSAQGGGQVAQQQQGDPMGSLLGSLLGGQGGGQAVPAQNDPISTLLGGLLGGGSAAAQGQPQQGGTPSGQGINIQQLMAAGMAFMQARQRGATPFEALVQAVMAGSQMNNSAAHSQSGQLVAGTLIDTIGSILGGLKR